MPVSRRKRHTKLKKNKATVVVKVKKKKASQKLEELPSAAVILNVMMNTVTRLLMI